MTSKFILLFIVSFALLEGCLTKKEEKTNATKPNIVFILIDDMGWKDLACMGSKYYLTPNIDQLASEGMLFEQAYSAGPVCSPSRAAILSGQYPARNKMTEGPEMCPSPDSLMAKNDNKGKNLEWLPTRSPARRGCLHPDQITFAEVMQSAGYKTGYLGKWHCGYHESQWPDKQGFEMAEGFRTLATKTHGHYGRDYIPKLSWDLKGLTADEYMSDALTRRAQEFITEHQAQPFLLVLSHYLVHAPFQAKPELLEKWKKVPTTDQNNPTMAAMIESVDQSVGDIMNTLKELNLDENTIVIFSSDNGGYHVATSTYPLLGTKAMPYEGSSRVPLIFKWKNKIKAAAKDSTPTVQVDLYPTMLDLAGIKPDPNQFLDGVSLKPILMDNGKLNERPIFFHFPHYSGVGCTPFSAIRYQSWKLYRYYNTQEGTTQLFNLKTDPNEQDNLAEKRTDITDSLNTLLTEWLLETDAPMPTTNKIYNPSDSAQYSGMESYRKSQTIRQKSEALLK